MVLVNVSIRVSIKVEHNFKCADYTLTWGPYQHKGRTKSPHGTFNYFDYFTFTVPESFAGYVSISTEVDGVTYEKVFDERVTSDRNFDVQIGDESKLTLMGYSNEADKYNLESPTIMPLMGAQFNDSQFAGVPMGSRTAGIEITETATPVRETIVESSTIESPTIEKLTASQPEVTQNGESKNGEKKFDNKLIILIILIIFLLLIIGVAIYFYNN